MFYFILGYYLDNTELKASVRKVIYVLGGLGFFLTFFLTEILSLKSNSPMGNYYSNHSLNVALEAVCIHTVFKYQKAPLRSTPNGAFKCQKNKSLNKPNPPVTALRLIILKAYLLL